VNIAPKRQKLLLKHCRRLQKVFDETLLTTIKSGHARTWFVPYLAEVLSTYIELAAMTANGKQVKGLPKNRRRAIRKLIRKSGRRDRRTNSRWATALAEAARTGVTPESLNEWLRTGGGVSGQARRVADRKKKKRLDNI
jgi:hypothetical protein